MRVRYALAIFATILASPLACSSSEQFGGSASPFRVGSPESQGFSSAALEALYTKRDPARTRALLVIRRDTIVFEQYSDPDQKKHSTASLAKGLVGSLALLLVLDDGRVQLDAPASNYIPAWRTDPDKSLITLRQLATHTSGLEDSFLPEGIPPSELGWKGEYWEKRREAASFLLARDRARVRFMPGTRVAYSNTGYDMLAYAITASLRGGEFSDIRELVRERVMRPIGVPDTAWSVGYGSTSEVDGLPLVAIAGGGSYTARAVARVGRLLLNKGRWDGQRLFDPVLTQVATQSSVRGAVRCILANPQTNH